MLLNCRIRRRVTVSRVYISVSVAQKLINMLLLRTAPQDLPYSSALMSRVIFLYLLTGMVVLNGVVEPPMALARMILSIGVLLLFSYIALSLLGLRARLVQTVTALVGTGIAFNLMAWPLIRLSEAETEPATMSGLASLIMLLLVSWEVMVTSHIYRHALNIQMAKAIILSIGLFLISMTLSQLVFPPS